MCSSEGIPICPWSTNNVWYQRSRSRNSCSRTGPFVFAFSIWTTAHDGSGWRKHLGSGIELDVVDSAKIYLVQSHRGSSVLSTLSSFVSWLGFPTYCLLIGHKKWELDMDLVVEWESHTGQVSLDAVIHFLPQDQRFISQALPPVKLTCLAPKVSLKAAIHCLPQDRRFISQILPTVQLTCLTPKGVVTSDVLPIWILCFPWYFHQGLEWFA